jgi:hypothetical protein
MYQHPRRMLPFSLSIAVVACDVPEESLDEAEIADAHEGSEELSSAIDPASSHVHVFNSGFDSPWAVPAGEPATTLAVCSYPPGAFGWSASKYWTVYANTPATSINSWITDAPSYPPGGPLGPSNLMAVGGDQDGIVQELRDPATAAPLGQCTATDLNAVSAWVYVVAGAAQLQFGNGGAGGGIPEVSTTQGEWEQITACGRGDLLNNQITIYGVGPSVFYVDDVEAKFSDACAVCSHDAHTEGAPLSADCGLCESTLCAADPFCCSTWWDAACVSQAATLCPDACP